MEVRLYPKLPDCRKSFVFRKYLMSRPLVLPVRAACRKRCVCGALVE